MVQINRKLDHYFEHGTRLVWLVSWKTEQVHIYTPDSIEALTRPHDVSDRWRRAAGFQMPSRTNLPQSLNSVDGKGGSIRLVTRNDHSVRLGPFAATIPAPAGQ